MTIRLLGADRGLTVDEWKEEQYTAHRAELAAMPRPERKNVALALSLARLDVLEYRGVVFDVRYLSYADGLELMTLRGDLSEIGRAMQKASADAKERGEPQPDQEPSLRRILDVLKRSAELFARNVSLPAPPALSGWRAAIQRVRLAFALARSSEPMPSNPFLSMTQAEATALFDFFSECQTRSGVRSLSQAVTPSPMTSLKIS